MIHHSKLYAKGENGIPNTNSTDEEAISFVEENLNDPKVTSFFNIEDDYTFDRFKSFTYNENNYGFRSNIDYSINNEPNEIWCFGCSCTYGQGVPVEYTWPSFIKNITGKTVKNFGVTGAGPQTTIRLLENWLQLSDYKPEAVYILGHFDGRCEVEISKFNYITFNAHSGSITDRGTKNPHILKKVKQFFLDSDYQYEVLNIRIENAIKEYGISKFRILNPLDTNSVMLYDGTVGRDVITPRKLLNYYHDNNKSFSGWNRQLAHPSPKFHKAAAEYFLNNS